MSDPKGQTTITPHNQQPLVTRTYPSTQDLEKVILCSADAQKQWAKVPLSDRIAIANKFVVSAAMCLSPFLMPSVPCLFKDEFSKMSKEIPEELTLQMGR
jgi:hypothetical protein